MPRRRSSVGSRRKSKDYVALGFQAAREGRIAEAQALYRKAIRDGDDYGYNNLAQLLIDEGRLVEAEELFRLGAKAGDALAAKNLALFLLEEGQEEEATRAIQVARRMGKPPTRREIAEAREYHAAESSG